MGLILLSNSMDQGRNWEAESHSAVKDISAFYEQYSVHNSPPLDSILSQMFSVNILTSYLFKFHFNIVLLSAVFGYVSQVASPLEILWLTFCMRVSCPAHPIFLDLSTLISLIFHGMQTAYYDIHKKKVQIWDIKVQQRRSSAKVTPEWTSYYVFSCYRKQKERLTEQLHM
jgi:hypothetical protein